MLLLFNTDLKSVICPWVYLLLEYKNSGGQDTNCVKAPKSTATFFLFQAHRAGAPKDNFRKIICSEDNLRSRIFGSFSEKISCLPASPRIFELQKNRIIAHF